MTADARWLGRRAIGSEGVVLKCLSVAAYRRRCFVTSRFVSGSHQQWPIGFGGGLEGCGPSQPWFADINQRFTAPTERASSRESASNGPSVSVQAWRAAVPGSCGSPISTPPHGADGAGALQGIGQQWPIRFGPGLEGCGPSQPRFADINTTSRRRRSGRPPGNRPAMARRFRCRPGGLRSLAAAVRRYQPTSRRRRSGRPPGNRPAMAHRFRCGPGGLRSLAAALRRYLHHLTAPTERTPSKAIGQQWLLRTPLQPLLKDGALVSVAQNLVTIRHTALSPFAGYL